MKVLIITLTTFFTASFAKAQDGGNSSYPEGGNRYSISEVGLRFSKQFENHGEFETNNNGLILGGTSLRKWYSTEDNKRINTSQTRAELGLYDMDATDGGDTSGSSALLNFQRDRQFERTNSPLYGGYSVELTSERTALKRRGEDEQYNHTRRAAIGGELGLNLASLTPSDLFCQGRSKDVDVDDTQGAIHIGGYIELSYEHDAEEGARADFSAGGKLRVIIPSSTLPIAEGSTCYAQFCMVEDFPFNDNDEIRTRCRGELVLIPSENFPVYFGISYENEDYRISEDQNRSLLMFNIGLSIIERDQ